MANANRIGNVGEVCCTFCGEEHELEACGQLASVWARGQDGGRVAQVLVSRPSAGSGPPLLFFPFPAVAGPVRCATGLALSLFPSLSDGCEPAGITRRQIEVRWQHGAALQRL